MFKKIVSEPTLSWKPRNYGIPVCKFLFCFLVVLSRELERENPWIHSRWKVFRLGRAQRILLEEFSMLGSQLGEGQGLKVCLREK